tara:strand:+ start:356 stop:538 length:183 start_codon:yes stop_codon:yes gene_type:complete
LLLVFLLRDYNPKTNFGVIDIDHIYFSVHDPGAIGHNGQSQSGADYIIVPDTITPHKGFK